jgi:hypothetical protein
MEATIQTKLGAVEKPCNPSLIGLMTKADIDATNERLAKIGADGSVARQVAFEFSILASMISDATRGGHDFYEKAGKLEQCWLKIRAIRDRFNFTNERIESGLTWAKEKGIIEASFYVPDVNFLIVEAQRLIKERLVKSKEAKTAGTKKNGQKQQAQHWQDAG